MSDEVQALDGFDLSTFDPSTWKEPVEIIPVRVKVSRPRWSSPEYNKKSEEFRPPFPNRGHGVNGNSIMQWQFDLTALDREFALADGSTAEVTLYAGVDLEKFQKDRNGNYSLTRIMKGKSKEALIIGAWTKAAGTLMPDPSRLEGQMWLVERYAQKEMAPNFFAKNVILPKELLAPTYVYTGQKLIIPVKDKTAVDEAATTDGAAAFGGSGVDVATAAERIGAFVRANGFSQLDTTVLGAPGFPDGCRIEPFVSAFAKGDDVARTTLASFGVEV